MKDSLIKSRKKIAKNLSGFRIGLVIISLIGIFSIWKLNSEEMVSKEVFNNILGLCIFILIVAGLLSLWMIDYKELINRNKKEH